MASLIVAYILWIIGGPFGLYHAYLGDDFKALLYMSTFGGFLLGWLRDLWCIPSYVRIVNGEEKPVDETKESKRKRKSFFLLSGLWGVSFLFGRIGTLAFAPDWATPLWWEMIVRATACSLGIYLVAHSSFHRTMTKPGWHLFGLALATQLIMYLIPKLDQYAWASLIPSANTATALATAIYAYKNRLYVTGPKSADYVAPRMLGLQSRGLRFVLIAVCAFALLSSLPLAFFWNASVDVDGEKVPLGKHFSEFYQESSAEDWKEVFRTWILSLREFEQFTVRGVDKLEAYETLGLKEGASMHEVKRRFRSLAKELHPDKHDASKRKMYEEKFAKVQQAYHVLIEIFGREDEKDEL